MKSFFITLLCFIDHVKTEKCWCPTPKISDYFDDVIDFGDFDINSTLTDLSNSFTYLAAQG